MQNRKGKLTTGAESSIRMFKNITKRVLGMFILNGVRMHCEIVCAELHTISLDRALSYLRKFL